MSKIKDSYQEVVALREERAIIETMISDIMFSEVAPGIRLLQEASLNVLKKFAKKLDHTIALETLLTPEMQWVFFDFNDMYSYPDAIKLVKKTNMQGFDDQYCTIDSKFLDLSVWEMCSLTRQVASQEYKKNMREQCIKVFNKIQNLNSTIDELHRFISQHAKVFAESVVYEQDDTVGTP